MSLSIKNCINKQFQPSEAITFCPRKVGIKITRKGTGFFCSPPYASEQQHQILLTSLNQKHTQLFHCHSEHCCLWTITVADSIYLLANVEAPQELKLLHFVALDNLLAVSNTCCTTEREFSSINIFINHLVLDF